MASRNSEPAANSLWTRLTYQGLDGLIRCHGANSKFLMQNLDKGIVTPIAGYGLPCYVDCPAPGAGIDCTKDVLMKPDKGTFHEIPYLSTRGRTVTRAFCEIFNPDGTPSIFDSRQLLKRLIQTGKDEFGLIFRVGFEEEFFLAWNKPGAFKDNLLLKNGYCSYKALNVANEFLAHLTEDLEEQGFRLECILAECGDGQIEMTMQHEEILTAIENHLIFRETVHGLAGKYGMKASFSPKIDENIEGSGGHIHISLNSLEGQNLVGDENNQYQLTQQAQSFMAGVLEHLPAILAITCGSVISYKRIIPGNWAGAFKAWGPQNKEAALRLPSSGGRLPTNFEIKTSDHTQNSFLALAAVLAAGFDGLRRNLSLPTPALIDPGQLSEAERAAAGMEQLPSNLEQALQRLEADQYLRSVLSDQLITAFAAIKRFEINYAEGLSKEELFERDADLW